MFIKSYIPRIVDLSESWKNKMLLTFFFALPAAILIFLLWRMDQTDRKARAKTRAELVPILTNLTKALDIASLSPKAATITANRDLIEQKVVSA